MGENVFLRCVSDENRHLENPLVWSLGALVSEEETKSKLRPYRITQPCPLHVTISRFYSQGSQSVVHNRGRAKVFRTNCLTA